MPHPLKYLQARLPGFPLLASYSEREMTNMNHTLKHGIDARCAVIPGEMHEDLEALAVQYQDHMRPADPVERYLVDTLIYSDWCRRRLMRVQAGVFGATVTDHAGPGTLAVIFKQQSAMERAYLRALTELRRRQNERNQPEPAPEPKPIHVAPSGKSPSKPPQMGGIGFVPSIPDFSIPSLYPLPPPVASAFGRFPNGEPLAVRR